MKSYRTSGVELVTSFWRNRSLIVALTKREVISRYQGSTLGITWSFFNPILLLAVYTFFFSVVFKARWGSDTNLSNTEFALILFSGLIIYNLFSECLQRSPTLIVSNVNYVKKVIFPLEIMPWVALGAALFHASISFLILIFAIMVYHQTIQWTVILFPVILIPLSFWTLGISWFLAGLGVYVRDISQITGMVVTVLLFLSPVFYPITALPVKYQWVANLNPLAFIIESGRSVLIFGTTPNWGHWVIFTLFSMFFSWMGFFAFQKLRKGFADVL